MAATYYCDLAADFVDRAGDVDHILTGPGGFFLAVDNGAGAATKLAAGDILYVKGTADLQKLVKFTVNVDKSATWVPGHVCRNYVGTGDDWVGVIVYVTATEVWFQINAASATWDEAAIADGIQNTTLDPDEQIEAANISSKGTAPPGISFLNAASGNTTTGSIRIIGCDSSFVARAAQAIFDGDLTAAKTASAYCIDCATSNPNVDYWRWEYITFQRAVTANIGAPSATNACDNWNFIHCLITLGTAAGLLGRFASSILERCVVTNNGSDGCSFGTQSAIRVVGCFVATNGGWGLTNVGGNLVVQDSLIYDNTSGNAQGYAAGTFAHSVLDGTNGAGDAITNSSVSQHALVVWACRITNNLGMGINVPAYIDDTWIIDFNVFYGNTGADVDSGLLEGPDNLTQDAAEITSNSDGYLAAPVTNGFIVVAGKEHSRSVLVLDWSNSGVHKTWVTAGLPPAGMVGTYPAANKVDSGEADYGPTGVEYDPAMDLTAYVLKAHVVAAGDVRYNVPRWTVESGSTNGTCFVPLPAQVEWNVAVDVAGTGTYTPPNTDGHTADPSLVKNTAHFGAGNATPGQLNMDLWTLISGVVSADYVLYNHPNYTGGTAGNLTLPNIGPPYTPSAALVDTSGHFGTNNATSGGLDLTTYTLKSGVVATDAVIKGHNNYTPADGGGDGDFDVTNCVATKIRDGVTIGGTSSHHADGTYSPGGTYAEGQAAQLVTDKAAVTAKVAYIDDTQTILTIAGTLDMDLWTLISGLVAPADVRHGTVRYGGDATPGTCWVPAAANVYVNVDVDATKGTFTMPNVGGTWSSDYVLSTASFGPGNMYTGNYHEATEAEVKDAVSFGPSSNYTGNYSPGGTYAEGQAAQLVTDKAAVTAADDYVLDSTTILAIPGTFAVANLVPESIKDGVKIGGDSSQAVTGNYAGGAGGAALSRVRLGM
jgi:hypothetical protein